MYVIWDLSGEGVNSEPRKNATDIRISRTMQY